MREAFGCQIGLSDHTMGCGVAVAAVALGAVAIEKHFTLRRSDGGVDSAFSMEPDEFMMLRSETDSAWQGLGAVVYGGTTEEGRSRIFRRSIYVGKDLRAGDVLDDGNVRVIRPGYGLPPKYLDIVLGKRVNRDLSVGTPLSWDHIG